MFNQSHLRCLINQLSPQGHHHTAPACCAKRLLGVVGPPIPVGGGKVSASIERGAVPSGYRDRPISTRTLLPSLRLCLHLASAAVAVAPGLPPSQGATESTRERLVTALDLYVVARQMTIGVLRGRGLDDERAAPMPHWVSCPRKLQSRNSTRGTRRDGATLRHEGVGMEPNSADRGSGAPRRLAQAAAAHNRA